MSEDDHNNPEFPSGNPPESPPGTGRDSEERSGDFESDELTGLTRPVDRPDADGPMVQETLQMEALPAIPGSEESTASGETLEVDPLGAATVLDVGLDLDAKTPPSGAAPVRSAEAGFDSSYAELSTRVDEDLAATLKALQAANEAREREKREHKPDVEDDTGRETHDEDASDDAVSERVPEDDDEAARTTLDVRGSFHDSSIEDLPSHDRSEEDDELGHKQTGPQGTALLEPSGSSDPALLPPAFPTNTTGDALEVEASMSSAPRPPAPPSDANEADASEDGWAGYDDSGGWHTLSGESQVVAVEPRADSSLSVPHSPPPPGPMVFDSSANFEAQPQLIGIQGADTGRRHTVGGDEVLVGRSARCSVVLAEPSVSRQHARLERRGDGYWVVDLDSGNGTFVNGKRVGSSRILSGDQVSFGNGVFQFVEADHPPDPRSEPASAQVQRAAPVARSMNWPLAFIVTTLLMVLVVGGVAVALKVAESRRAMALNRAFSRWNAGVEYFKARDWNQAEQRFADALELVPDHKRSLRYLDALRRERDAQKTIVEAETALRQKDLETAYQLALQVSGSLAYGQRAGAVVAAVDQMVDRRLGRARVALKAGRFETIEEELAGLGFIEPYRPEIARIRAAQTAQTASDPEQRNNRRRRR